MILTIKEIFRGRNLIRQLVIKDLKIRYCRPLLGFFWAFLSPCLLVLILYVVFSLILAVKIEDGPFFLYLMSAVFTWRFFQDSIIHSVASLMDNKNLIKESGFAHYFIPLSIVLANTLVFLPVLFLLIVISLILKGISVFILFLPFVLLIHLTMAIGLSIIFSILYVKWRDIKYVLEPLMLLLFYLTPAFYSLSLVKNTFSPPAFTAYISNPFVGLLSLYRIVLFNGFYNNIHNYMGLLYLIVIPFSFAIIVFFLGFYLYRINKNTINDHISY